MDESRSQRQIGIWLFAGALLVVVMVILGGYTRLSHSGLSMVTWKPIIGAIPPLNELAWEEEFSRYKSSPEYQKRNYDFSLEEFKSIYWPEFYHRLLGRIMGLAFMVPFLYFLFSKQLKNGRLIRNLMVIFLLGGLQGMIGWYMVKSGLVDDPNVSHYRLAIHLGTALLLFVYILWTALKVSYPGSELKKDASTLIRPFKVLFAFTSIQIIYGALVAGLKAGLYYPTWPMMGSTWLPSEAGVSIVEKGIISFFESASLVQFMHRWIAVFVIGIIFWIYFKTRKLDLNEIQIRIMMWMLIIVGIQFTLGVLTLLYHVPISLGVLHQFGAVALLTINVLALYFFKGTRINN
jgi:heme a synthase